MNEVILEFCNISFGYDSKKTLLNKVGFKVHANEIVTILGASGKGKTTILKLANRLLSPTRGDIFYLNKNINTLSPLKLRKELCYLSQIPYMIEGTVKDNIVLPFIKDKLPYDVSHQVNSLLLGVGLDSSYLNRIASDLSVGEQQRVALCRIMLNRCKILLLDEPNSALDYKNTLTLVKTLKELIITKGLSLVVITHKLSFAKLLGGRNLVLKDTGISETDNLNQAILY
jgi:putative ABC transport system ATP-binding protein